jgi:hypothetical protein
LLRIRWRRSLADPVAPLPVGVGAAAELTSKWLLCLCSAVAATLAPALTWSFGPCTGASFARAGLQGKIWIAGEPVEDFCCDLAKEEPASVQVAPVGQSRDGGGLTAADLGCGIRDAVSTGMFPG